VARPQTPPPPPPLTLSLAGCRPSLPHPLQVDGVNVLLNDLASALLRDAVSANMSLTMGVRPMPRKLGRNTNLEGLISLINGIVNILVPLAVRWVHACMVGWVLGGGGGGRKRPHALALMLRPARARFTAPCS
jgi:hypothetical protein